MINLKENCVLEVRKENLENLSTAQLELLEVLKKRKLIFKKIINGAGIKCECCEKKSIKNECNFVVVENEKKEEKKIAENCFYIYYGINIKGKGKGKGRVNRCSL